MRKLKVKPKKLSIEDLDSAYKLRLPSPEIKQLLDEADFIICAFSGGKDSISLVLELIRWGYKQKLELWHQNIDGAEDEENFMDWACTPDYARKFAAYFDIPLYFSYKHGGFKRELLKNNAPTAPTSFQLPDGSYRTTGGTGKRRTRLRFPPIENEIANRWCTFYTKIAVMNTAIRNQLRFNHAKTVVVTGERRVESGRRAKYQAIQPHQTNLEGSKKGRNVTHYRLLLDYSDQEVWSIMRDWLIQPHVAYEVGMGRCSCQGCIFLSQDDLATLLIVNPEIIERLEAMEIALDHTIAYDSKLSKQLTIRDRAERGFPKEVDPIWIAQARSKTWNHPIVVPEGTWQLPLGATRGSSNSGSP